MSGYRFSPFVMPLVRLGEVKLDGPNMHGGDDRLRWLDGMVARLGELAGNGFVTERYGKTYLPGGPELERFFAATPFARELVELIELEGGEWKAREKDGARDRLAFRADRLNITFFDGRDRVAPKPQPVVRSGRHTPQVAALVSHLYRGVSEATLEELAEQASFNASGLFDRLLADGSIEPAEPAAATSSYFERNNDRVTWLGHACVLFQSGASSVVVDPYVLPRLAFREDERPHVFDPSFADRVLAPAWPNVHQRTAQDLPRLDAVCVTHWDWDHFDLSTLMVLPDDVPIVVPRYSGHPWDNDMVAVVRNVLGGGRTVIALGHGERYRAGDVEIVALPFRGEFPPGLELCWNTYLLNGRTSSALLLADAHLPDEYPLLEAAARPDLPMVVFANQLREGPPPVIHGYGDRGNDVEIYNRASLLRLWGLYLPLLSSFEPARPNGLWADQLAALAAKLPVRQFFPYARGSLPWYRPETHTVYPPFDSQNCDDLARIESLLGSLSPRVAMLPARYGEPVELG